MLTSGFTLTELLVLVGVSSMLAGLLLADLTEAKAKLWQQACAANLKHWGMAFDLYSQDYNGTFYYDVGGAGFDDSFAPYGRYLNTNPNPIAAIRTVRVCPVVAARMPGVITVRSYTMPIGTYRKGLKYTNADVTGSPFYDGANNSYWPNLKSAPRPSEFLLLIEGRGNTIHCGNTALHDAVTQLHTGTGGDTVTAINRHSAVVNCLFGDYHVAPLSIEQIDAMDGNCTGTNPPNYAFALN
jgi:type II secretory pathway pseudopilin PulG